MTPQITSAIIAFAGVVLSAVIAHFTARYSSKRELEKLRLTWAREDSVSSDEDFSEMVFAVTRFLQSHERRDEVAAIEKISTIRSKESGALADQLDLLYQLMQSRKATGQPDDSFLDQCLTAAVKQKREAQSRKKMGH